MGQDTRSLFQYLKDEGYNFLIGGFHVKGQVVDARGVAAWGYGGQTVERGDWKDGKPSDRPADQLERLEEADRALRARAAGHGAARPAGLPAEPLGGLAGPPAGRPRAAGPGRGQHASGGRARVPARPDPGQGAPGAGPGRAPSPSPARSTRPPPACTPCSARCWRPRTSPPRAADASPIGARLQIQAKTKTYDVCIVGSGAGGGMAAKVLSRRRRRLRPAGGRPLVGRRQGRRHVRLEPHLAAARRRLAAQAVRRVRRLPGRLGHRGRALHGGRRPAVPVVPRAHAGRPHQPLGPHLAALRAPGTSRAAAATAWATTGPSATTT